MRIYPFLYPMDRVLREILEVFLFFLFFLPATILRSFIVNWSDILENIATLVLVRTGRWLFTRLVEIEGPFTRREQIRKILSLPSLVASELAVRHLAAGSLSLFLSLVHLGRFVSHERSIRRCRCLK